MGLDALARIHRFAWVSKNQAILATIGGDVVERTRTSWASYRPTLFRGSRGTPDKERRRGIGNNPETPSSVVTSQAGEDAIRARSQGRVMLAASV